MSLNRREFLKRAGLAGVGVSAVGLLPQPARASEAKEPSPDAMGVLVDIPKCIGCRRCEYACQDSHGFNPPPVEAFEDKSVFDTPRRPYPHNYTVINQYPNPRDATHPIYNKFNCLHCVDPACASACLVSALQKREDGPVVYDPSRCMGCRYCMVACPFEIPTYDYDVPLTPQVRKCNFCVNIVPAQQSVPACVKICPAEVMTYGRRSELLVAAREKIRAQPDVYVDHIYGEHEVGGTSWMSISPVPLEQVGFKQFSLKAPPRLTERIQHSEFKYFIPPMAWYGLLGVMMWLTRPEPGGSATLGDTA